MKIFSNYLGLVILVFMLSFGTGIHCQTRMQLIELNTFKALNKLSAEVKNHEKKDDLEKSLQELSSSAMKLFGEIREKGNFDAEGDSLFVGSLDDSQKALNGLLADWESDDNVDSMFADIKKDFDIKMTSSQLAAVSGAVANIEVTVLTKSATENISGYDVFYTYMWDLKKKEKKNVFTNQTNDAVKNLSPGYYFFWIEKDGKIVKTKTKIEIGNLMMPKETVVFNL